MIEPSEIHFFIWCMEPGTIRSMKEMIDSYNNEVANFDLIVKDVSVRPLERIQEFVADFELSINAPFLDLANTTEKLIKIRLRQFAEDLRVAIGFYASSIELNRLPH